jgi:hypothetical protein
MKIFKPSFFIRGKKNIGAYMPQETISNQSFFDKVNNETPETKRAAELPRLKRNIQRKLSSAFDDAEVKVQELEASLDATRRLFKSYDVNEVLRQTKEVAALKVVMSNIQKEYEFMFGEKLS